MARTTLPDRNERALRVVTNTRAAPEALWEAWTNPMLLTQWLTDRASGAAQVDDTITWSFDRLGADMSFRVAAVDPPRLLRLHSRGAENQPGLIELEISGEAGATQVAVTHSGFAEGASGDEALEGARSGWQLVLAIMAHYVERYFGRPRVSFLALREAPVSYESLIPYYRKPERLRRWLTAAGSIGEPGENFTFVLRNGRKMSGEVLAVTDREVALSWNEIQGVLELKAFDTGRGIKALCVRGSGWNLAPARAVAIEKEMGAALDRLRATVAPGA